MRFSERFGFRPARLELQKNDIDKPLRASLWTALSLTILNFTYELKGWESRYYLLAQRTYVHFFKLPIDEAPRDPGDFRALIKKFILSSEWHAVYDLIEYFATAEDRNNSYNERRAIEFESLVNQFLEEEKSAYRLVGNQITPLTSDSEIAEVDRSANLKGKFAAVSQHVSAALRFYNDRKSADYRNSIKESISAVEAAARIITGDDKATLGAALKVLNERHSLHPALKEAFSRLYGYTNDEGGIRHAMLEQPNIDEGDARFMLVVCSAFINLLILRSW